MEQTGNLPKQTSSVHYISHRSDPGSLHLCQSPEEVLIFPAFILPKSQPLSSRVGPPQPPGPQAPWKWETQPHHQGTGPRETPSPRQKMERAAERVGGILCVPGGHIQIIRLADRPQVGCPPRRAGAWARNGFRFVHCKSSAEGQREAEFTALPGQEHPSLSTEKSIPSPRHARGGSTGGSPSKTLASVDTAANRPRQTKEQRLKGLSKHSSASVWFFLGRTVE